MSEQGDEWIKRTRMALSEVGYQNVTLWEDATEFEGCLVADIWEVPAAIIWMAWKLTGVPCACWSCANAGRELGLSCWRGDCDSPDGPHYPPRHLLQRNDHLDLAVGRVF